MRKRVLYFIVTLALVVCVAFPMMTPVMASQILATKDTIPALPNMYRVGDTIHYEMTVRNPQGNTATNNLTNIWDVLPDGSIHWFVQEGTDPPLIQTPGQNATFYLDYVVDWNDAHYSVGLGYWIVIDTFRVEGHDSNFDRVSANVTKNSRIIQPAIHIEKYTNGQDADAPPGPLIAVGGNVTWTYVVTNTGDVELTGVNVTDDQLGPIGTIPFLAVNGSQTLYAYGTAVAGQYANNATATGTPPVGDPVSDSDPSHYFGSEAAIHIEKYTNGEDADAPTGPLIVAGDNVTWTYNVTNIGGLNLTGIVVTDDHLGVIPGPASGDVGSDGILEPYSQTGESWIYQATGVAAAGQYANNATVVGYYNATEVTDSDPSHYLGLGPAIDIEKYTNGQDADTPTGPSIPVGGAVNWTYYVSNTGDVPLTGINVTDDQPGVIPGYVSGDDGDGVLNITEIWIYWATGVAIAGQYGNTGTVVGYYNATQVTDSDPSHYLGLSPGIDIEKHTNGADADAPPGPYISVNSSVNWTYIVTNTGALNLTGIVVTDDHLGVIPGPASGDVGSDGILEPYSQTGETWIYQAAGVAVAGQYANNASVVGYYGATEVTDSDPSHYYNRPSTVGWETYPVNKARVLLPWIALLTAIVSGTGLLVLRHRRAHS